MNKPTLLALACGMLFAGAMPARADEADLAVPDGAAPLLQVIADGVQIYVCEAKEGGGAWAFKAPEAALFDREGRQVGTHFAGPSWKLGDGSTVVGEVVGKADAAEPDAIPWLLLRAKSHEGAGVLAGAAFIRRIETEGGAAPEAGCDAQHIAEEARMRYSAVYEFYGAAK